MYCSFLNFILYFYLLVDQLVFLINLQKNIIHSNNADVRAGRYMGIIVVPRYKYDIYGGNISSCTRKYYHLTIIIAYFVGTGLT